MGEADVSYLRGRPSPNLLPDSPARELIFAPANSTLRNATQTKARPGGRGLRDKFHYRYTTQSLPIDSPNPSATTRPKSSISRTLVFKGGGKVATLQHLFEGRKKVSTQVTRYLCTATNARSVSRSRSRHLGKPCDRAHRIRTRGFSDIFSSSLIRIILHSHRSASARSAILFKTRQTPTKRIESPPRQFFNHGQYTESSFHSGRTALRSRPPLPTSLERPRDHQQLNYR